MSVKANPSTARHRFGSKISETMAPLCRASSPWSAAAVLAALAALAALGQVPPVGLGHLDVVALRGGHDPLPRLIPLGVADPLNLVEAGDRVAYVPLVRQRLLALLREGEILVRQVVLPVGSHDASFPPPLLSDTGDCLPVDGRPYTGTSPRFAP